MKTFFFMGRNSNNKSGVSWKIWRIDCKGRKVTTWWGPAAVVKRRVKPKGVLQSKSRKFQDAATAKQFARVRTKNKLTKGYERKPRRGKWSGPGSLSNCDRSLFTDETLPGLAADRRLEYWVRHQSWIINREVLPVPQTSDYVGAWRLQAQ